jgi:hypothetical protein
VERDRLEGLDTRWANERQLVDELLALRAKLRAGIKPVESTGSNLEAAALVEAQVKGLAPDGLDAQRQIDLAQLQTVQDKLSALQGDEVVQFDDVLARLQVRAQSLVVELSPNWPRANRRRGPVARSPA